MTSATAGRSGIIGTIVSALGAATFFLGAMGFLIDPGTSFGRWFDVSAILIAAGLLLLMVGTVIGAVTFLRRRSGPTALIIAASGLVGTVHIYFLLLFLLFP